MTPRLLVMPVAAVLAVASLATEARAQAYLPEDNLAYPVQVVVQGGGGTGFFVRRDRDLFLVTARHVVASPATGELWSGEATLRALSKDLKETAVTVIHLNVAQLKEERRLRVDAIRDVAVMHLGTLKADGVNTTPGVVITDTSKAGIIVAPFDYLTRFADVDVSSQIFMLGYPSIGVTGAAQIDRTRPLVRGGIVAGVKCGAENDHHRRASESRKQRRSRRATVADQQTPHYRYCYAVRSASLLVAHVAGARQLGLRGRRVRGRNHRSDRGLLITKACRRVRAMRTGALR
jgi:trypsin-like peptidase